jgi:hypothetical protein
MASSVVGIEPMNQKNAGLMVPVSSSTRVASSPSVPAKRTTVRSSLRVHVAKPAICGPVSMR